MNSLQTLVRWAFNVILFFACVVVMQLGIAFLNPQIKGHDSRLGVLFLLIAFGGMFLLARKAWRVLTGSAKRAGRA